MSFKEHLVLIWVLSNVDSLKFKKWANFKIGMHQYVWISSGVYLKRMINEEKYKQ